MSGGLNVENVPVFWKTHQQGCGFEGGDMKKKSSSGQGLMEYALILMLVALVVIVILAVVGPGIGNVFSNVMNGLVLTETAQAAVTPTSPPIWTFCANEDGFCAFSGTKQVRYGKNGSYYYGTFTDGIACTNGVFGDPLYLTVKECNYR
jgi:Flp pilus assembly pilin Flp